MHRPTSLAAVASRNTLHLHRQPRRPNNPCQGQITVSHRAAGKQAEPKRGSELRNDMTYDRLRLMMSLRGVDDLVAMLAVTSTRMSEGRPAMSMPRSAEFVSPVVVLSLLEPGPTAKQARVSIPNCGKVGGEVQKKLVCGLSMVLESETAISGGEAIAVIPREDLVKLSCYFSVLTD